MLEREVKFMRKSVSSEGVVSSEEVTSSKEVAPAKECQFDRTLHVYGNNRSCTLKVCDSDRKKELYVLRQSKLFKRKGDPDYTIFKCVPDGVNKNSAEAIIATSSPSILSRSYDIYLHGVPLTVKLNSWCCDAGVKYVSRHRGGNILSWKRTNMFSERWELLNFDPHDKKKLVIEKLGRIEMGIWARHKVARIHLPSWVDGDFLDEIATTALGVIEGEQLVYISAAAAT